MADFKYILFTHLANPDKGMVALEKAATRLGECLNAHEAEGMLVVFVDPGWLSLLNTIGTDFNPVRMAEEFKTIGEIETRVEKLKASCRRASDRRLLLRDHLRLVTAKTLYPILNNLRGGKPGLEATRLKNFLVGSDPGVRYDTTKVVEALIRVRHLGSGVPVLRIDWDALLNDQTLTRLLEKLALRVPSYCERLTANHRVHSYVVSGLYDAPDGHADWDATTFNSAFATRMFPGLVPTEEAVAYLDAEAVPNSDGRYTKDCDLNGDEEFRKGVDRLFKRDVMINYYGLDNPQAGLPALGSHPLESVVSGAGLVISEGAILDLPPFSNFELDVMWIDDYLKYELHRALGHFAYIETPGSTPRLPCREPGAKVFKDRLLAGQGDLRKYTLGRYIPTLFWGILVDGWIRGASFFPNDFVNLGALAKNLETSRRGLDLWIRSKLSERTRDALTNAGSDLDTLQTALLQDLNVLLRGPAIYDPMRFNEIAMRPEAKQFLKEERPGHHILTQNPAGNDLLRFNRVLFEDAYPEHIRKQERKDSCPPFVVALEKALKRGLFDASERTQLRLDLEERAAARINKVIELWSALRSQEGCPSFAALWVGSDNQTISRVLGKLTKPDPSWPGWGLLKKPATRIERLEELREPIYRIVEQLIEDMCIYIDWTLEWPKVIQSVRAVKTGSLELDVSYGSLS